MRRVNNPPNPFESSYREWLAEAPQVRVEVYEEWARSILSKNDSPDLPFRWSVNPYRGCQHACAYCYARPYHEYLGMGAGTDFDTKIVVKVNAPELLTKAFRRASWRAEAINFSGVTDCYQPIEAVRSLTKRCLEVCLKYTNPVMIVTKAYLVMRDAELLVKLNQAAGCSVNMSIPFADDETARVIEPQAPPPSRRFDALRRLSDAGVPVGVFVSPIIPGLNDSEIPEVLRLAKESGARSANFTALRLPGSVAEVFATRIRDAIPLRADRILSRLRDIRGGRLNDSAFSRRMAGEGVYWESIRQLFEVSARKLGLVRPPDVGSG